MLQSDICNITGLPTAEAKPHTHPVHASATYPNTKTPVQLFHRNAKSLYEESFHDISLEKGTEYPCTREDLIASGGTHRRSALDALKVKDRRKWFAHPNNGPFLDARIAAREVFDHNDPKRVPSAAEDEAIKRLKTGFKNAATERWGPDLPIKMFCDLDKVFFGGRLKGNVCLTWNPDRLFPRSPSGTVLGITMYLGKGQCAILLNADHILLRPKENSRFVCMFATLLHEMWCA